MPKLRVVEFSYYPETTAVSQLLGDLLIRFKTENPQWRISVYCGGIWNHRNEYVKLFNGVKIRRLILPFYSRKNTAGKVLSYLWYYFAIFFVFLLLPPSDVVLCLTTPPLIASAVAPGIRKKRTQFVYYIEDLYPELLFDLGYLRKPRLIRRLEIIHFRTFAKADDIIVLGEDMRRKIERNYSISSSIHVIPNWGDVPEQLIMTNSCFRLLYSGNAGLAHDFELFMDLVASLRSYPNIEYAFRGNGVRIPWLKGKFRELGEGRASFSGIASRDQVIPFLQSASIFILAQTDRSIGDILPSKYYSYLACGRPILFLGPRNCEIGRELMKNDIGYVLEDRDDQIAALEWLITLNKFPTLAGQLGQRARDLYKGKYGFEQSYTAFARILLDGESRRLKV